MSIATALCRIHNISLMRKKLGQLHLHEEELQPRMDSETACLSLRSMQILVNWEQKETNLKGLGFVAPYMTIITRLNIVFVVTNSIYPDQY